MKKVTAEWIRKAEADLAAAEHLRQLKPPLTDPVCFHSQQTGEKYLKAFLQEHGVNPPKIHDLGDLLARALPFDPTLASLRTGLDRLTDYAVDYRYPGIHATSRQASSALKIATKVRDEIRRRLGLRNRGRPKRA
ncbi:MAG: HEPN domain-containing protein [Planctomycetales bacterium]|nr:HEPN domain-containing protein [Planctomycetales bacterium]